MKRTTTHMSTRDVAQLLGVSVATINRQAREGGALADAVVVKAPGRNGAYMFDGDAVAAMVAGSHR